jgi:Fur family ferric uptake transcriptional regulator
MQRASGDTYTSNAPEDSIEVLEPLCAVFRRALKGMGLKYTPERAHVLDTIIRFDAPFQAERVVEAVKGARSPGGGGGTTAAPLPAGVTRLRISKATVYRTIKLLLDAGIIQRVPLGEDASGRGEGFYTLVYGRRPSDMIIRTDTHEMVPINLPALPALVARACAERGLTLRGHRLYVYAERT